ncbi:MAG: dihydrolipoyl dehydrogenase [Mucinivorans sp.]
MFDLIIIGSGPGGYAGAIRASQLGLKVAIVERAELGGVCLNWGCIPTKALLKSAAVFDYARNASHYGVTLDGESLTADLDRMVERSRSVASQMSKGVEFLMKKNSIQVIEGQATIIDSGKVMVEDKTYEAKNIIIATGARPREFPTIPIDGVRILNSRHALTLTHKPDSIVVVGSGAIGLEFASFFNTLGVKVTVVEYVDRIAPLEDAEISSTLERALRKAKITIMTSTSVEKVEVRGEKCFTDVMGKKGAQTIESDVVLSAVGITANIENMGLESLGMDVERGKIVVDNHFQTSVSNIFAIGDVIATPALAHVATAEAINCVEYIANLSPQPIDYSVIPSCIYTTPEVSSVGMTQSEAESRGFEVKIGKFPFTASGKATSAGARDGLVKLVFDGATDKLLGAHFCGLNVTEMVAEPTLALKLGATAAQIIATIHPHPTMSEAVMEAAAAAHNEAIHV